MSVVEKAAERLKPAQARDPAAAGPAAATVTPVSPHITSVPSVERLLERSQVADSPTAVQTKMWHMDIAALKRVGLLPDEEAGLRLADELRRVKRPVLANAVGKGVKPVENGHRIMIASAVPGEGKTFMALNLALSLAKERDFEVLLVDGDIPKSDLTRVLKLESHPGLMDVLMEEQRRPEDVIVRTDVPNLIFVPVGQRNPLAAELFGSRRMEFVLREFSGHNQRRLLVFDSPPLLATSEALVLSTHMGQIILVAAAASTQQQTVKSAIQSLDGSKCISLILNRARPQVGNDYYGSYYNQNYKDR